MMTKLISLLIITVLVCAIVMVSPLRRSLAADCSRTSMGSIPLNDLGAGTYNGAQGGLYPGGSNTRPLAHELGGIGQALAVRPLDASGQPSPNGKYVLLSIGMSNTTQEFSTFKPMADADPRKNSNLVIVDGAQGGQDANDWNNPSSNTWNVAATRLMQAGVTSLQVQTVWLKEQFGGDQLPAFPTDAARLRDVLRGIVLIAKTKYPNLRVLYVSSRIYGNYNGPLRGKGAYENGFAVKWLVEDQINGDSRLAYAGTNPPAPWIAWGPYIWADGLTPRSDGLVWHCSDFVDDGIHPSTTGRQKVAQRLLDFLKTDSTARLWFLNTRRFAFDYDGDGKTDISVARPSNAVWYIQNSTGNPPHTFTQFGFGTDAIVPADYDGDGKTDIAVFRESGGSWFWQKSSTGEVTGTNFGASGDKPVPADYDGDGKADAAVFRPSTGTWWIYRSTDGQPQAVQFGIAEDIPTLGDFDGDGKSDVAVYRPSTGAWYRLNSGNGSFFAVQFGTAGDKPVAADYDGDGKSDIAVFRPSTGAWYMYNSSNGTVTGLVFGTNGDKPVAGDYDGDGRTDAAVFRPTDGVWYMMQTTAGFSAQRFGTSEDRPTPNAFVP